MNDELKRIKELFSKARDAWDDNYQRAADDLKFSLGEQWPEELRSKRENNINGAQPCLVLDKIGQYVRNVVNDARQNRPSIKVRPVDSAGDVKLADMLQGLVRNIEEQSSADIAYDNALEMSVRCGIGWIRVCTEYADDESFDQDIRIKPVPNPFSVYIDPDFQQPDGSDARYAFVIEDVPRKRFEAMYPNADPVSFEGADQMDRKDGWSSETHVRVAEFFEVVSTPEDMTKDGKTRKVQKRKVVWKKVSARDVLEEVEWPSRYIGLVPVWGRIYNIEGEVRIYSMINSAIDAQRMHNYSSSNFVERVALAPKSPFIAAEGQIEGHEDEWRTANTENYPVLTYKPQAIAGVQVPPPMRQQGADISEGWLSVMQNTQSDIQAALGMYNATIGAPSNERSGKAILARQREGDIATFDFIDNLSRAIRHLGRIMIDMIPKIYDTDRVVRLLEEDGMEGEARISPSLEQAALPVRDNGGNVIEMIYNPSIGKYDVTVAAGPGYNTKRQEAADFMNQVVQTRPEMMNIIGDLMFRALDMPFSEEIAQRMKALLPPQIQEMASANTVLPPEAQAVVMQKDQQMQQLAQQLEMMQQALNKAGEEIQQSKGDSQADMLKAQNDAQKVQIEQFKAETERLRLQLDAQSAQAESEKQEQMENGALSQIGEQIYMLSQAVQQLAVILDQQQQKMMQHMADMTEMICEHGEGSKTEIGSALEQIAQLVQQPRKVTKEGRAVRNADGTWSLNVDEVMH